MFARVRLPDYVPPERAVEYLSQHYGVGDQLTFDRYTLGTHQLHEHDAGIGHALDEGHTTIVFEIKTCRGMYLGGSSGSDQTGQLLPRGLHTRVVGAPHWARYRRRDGSEGRTLVIQITDDPDQEPTT